MHMKAVRHVVWPLPSEAFDRIKMNFVNPIFKISRIGPILLEKRNYREINLISGFSGQSPPCTPSQPIKFPSILSIKFQAWQITLRPWGEFCFPFQFTFYGSFIDLANYFGRFHSVWLAEIMLLSTLYPHLILYSATKHCIISVAENISCG